MTCKEKEKDSCSPWKIFKHPVILTKALSQLQTSDKNKKKLHLSLVFPHISPVSFCAAMEKGWSSFSFHIHRKWDSGDKSLFIMTFFFVFVLPKMPLPLCLIISHTDAFWQRASQRFYWYISDYLLVLLQMKVTMSATIYHCVCKTKAYKFMSVCL